MGEGGGKVRHRLHVLEAEVEIREQRVGGRLPQVRHQPVQVLGAERGDVDRESARDGDEHRGGERALVALDLIDIRGRDGEARGQLALLQPQLLP